MIREQKQPHVTTLAPIQATFGLTLHFWLVVALLLLGVGIAALSYNRTVVKGLLASQESAETPVGAPLGTSVNVDSEPPTVWKIVRYGGFGLILLAWVLALVFFGI
jgi:hypothetical protein